MNLQSISSNVNSDGKTKTSVTTVIDQNGKKYTISRLNDKITSLSVNGKDIPENEINQYSSLIEKIDLAIENKRQEKSKQQQLRKEEMIRKNEERRAKEDEGRRKKMEEIDKRRTTQEAERTKLQEKRSGENEKKHEKDMEKRKEDIEKRREKIEKESNRRREEMENKRQDIERRRKEMEKDRKVGMKLFTPKTRNPKLFLNGREVVENKDNSSDTKQSTNQQVKYDVKNKDLLNREEIKLKTSTKLFENKSILFHKDKTLFLVENKLQSNNNMQLKKTVSTNSDIKCTDNQEPGKKVSPPKKAEPAAVPLKKGNKTMPGAPNKPKEPSKFEYSQLVVT
jgi:hypothetical protein